MKAVISLQKLCLDYSVDVSEILLSARLIASKLNLDDFREYCNLEIDGYFKSETSNIPQYRWIKGRVLARKGIEIYSLSCSFDDSYKIFKDSIVKFENYGFDDEQRLYISIDKKIEDKIRKSKKISDEYDLLLDIHHSDIENALYSVRSKILSFSEELERNNILGEEWEFTEQEKQMTQNVNYHISNVGSMANHNENSTINQTSTNTVNVIKGDFNSLASNLRSHGIEEADIQELQTIINVTPLPQSTSEYSPELKSWMIKMIGKSIDGTWQIAVGAAGSLLATGIQHYFGILS
ncbi:hypothetical protein [Acinetobacter sp. AM]|jgi:hypothetical protein|uniref:AbiTii domain-containing protein n=1 Tax=Acinetobacter sp. AM TaxID=2170730 RepID=UPI0010581D61|nr:hypothetical protein [Acinetobacter sp. AM]